MSSLSAHLRHLGSHAGLRFHPECPVCRQERLAGQLPLPTAIVTHRTVAALTAGLLAVSAGAPPLAAAGREPDQEQSGAPDPAASSDSARNPDLDPGGAGNTASDAGPASPAPGTPEPDPPDPEPAKDTPAPVDDQGDKPDPDTQRQTGSATTQTPAAQTPAKPAASPTATATPTGVVAPTLVVQVPQTTLVPRRPQAPGRQPRHPKRSSHTTTPLGTSTREIQTSLPALRAQTEAPGVQPSGPAKSAGERDAGGARGARGGRAHVVVAGESLWSIARDQLGRGAPNADIAREVHRLWQLNAKAIATGNPDLLPVGTKLKLR